MKTPRRLFTTLFLLCLAGMATAQDVIVRTDNSTVLSKVLEISSTEIKYKKWDNQDGPIYSIDRSEVISINYQNGEVETFSGNTSNQTNTYQQQSQHNDAGYMDIYDGGFVGALRFNGRNVSDEQARSLLDEQSYQLYLKGVKDQNIRLASLSGSLLGLLTGGIIASTKMENKRTIAITCLGVSAVSAVVFLCFDGRDEFKQVASRYNRQHGNPISYSISPSLMKCDIPESPNYYGLGLTFCINH